MLPRRRSNCVECEIGDVPLHEISEKKKVKKKRNRRVIAAMSALRRFGHYSNVHICPKRYGQDREITNGITLLYWMEGAAEFCHSVLFLIALLFSGTPFARRAVCKSGLDRPLFSHGRTAHFRIASHQQVELIRSLAGTETKAFQRCLFICFFYFGKIRGLSAQTFIERTHSTSERHFREF